MLIRIEGINLLPYKIDPGLPSVIDPPVGDRYVVTPMRLANCTEIDPAISLAVGEVCFVT